ncbi:MAG: tetratricopeptide repeat protein [Kiritimatiellae bacterium]|nr:tetratricopeptide repeat protein [Kiritimatiellia bacterium]
MASDPATGDRLGLRDYVLAAAAGFLFFIVYLVWSSSGLDPSLWGEAAVAAGTRPAQTVFPGYWRLLAKPLFAGGEVSAAARTLRLLGSATGALSVSLVYLIVRQMLAFFARYRAPELWGNLATFFAAAATLCFAAGDHMWRMVQPLTPGAIRFFLILLSLHLTFRWYVKAGNLRLFALMFLLGLVAAETPLGFLLPVLAIVGYILVYNAVLNSELFSDGDLPGGYDLPKWRMFFLFAAGFLAGFEINVATFKSSGGALATGLDGFALLTRYATTYWTATAGASTPIGWVLTMALSVFPFVGVAVLAPRIARDNTPMPFGFGLLMFFAGILALLQTGIFPMMRVWEFAEGAVDIRSDCLMAVFALCSVITAAAAATLLAHECNLVYEFDDDMFTVVGRRGPFMRFLVPVLFAAMAVPVFLRIPHPVENEMRSIVDDALDETVRECGDARFVFTDGRLDAGLELAALSNGSRVRPLNMMGGSGSYDKHLRTRFFGAGDPDRETASTGVPVLMRVWAGEKENGMDESAIQLGFEFWKRARKPLPALSGMVARTKGLENGEPERGVAAAKELANRIIEVSKKTGGKVSSALKDALSAVSWRISRFARLRKDDDLADMLDDWNETVKKMMRLVEYERMRTFMQLTPYEGLRLALRRADFIEARRFGATVLQIDANDPEANFGTGMAYLMEDKLKEAQFYLERCLEARPEEPAVMNNLSIIYRKTGQLEKALEYAKRAYEILPDNEEVVDTLRQAEKAIEEAAPESGE